MGQCIITRRGGGVETEDYRFYTATSINTRATAWRDGSYTIDDPTITTSLSTPASSVNVTIGTTGWLASGILRAVGEETGTLKRGESRSFKFELSCSSTVAGYITDTVSLSQDGLTVSQRITYSKLATPKDSQQFTFGVTSLNAYLLRVK